MSEAGSINKDYIFWRLFDYAHRILDVKVIYEFHKRNLSPELINLLVMIYRAHVLLGYDPMPADLARKSHRKPQTITAIIKRAMEKGYIEKIEKSSRHNTYRLILTIKGVGICQKVVDIPIYSKLFSILTKYEHDQLEAILSKLVSKTKKCRTDRTWISQGRNT
jgi:DNA-binding MarR family transcriptional regulator